jgi:hypothetical protein
VGIKNWKLEELEGRFEIVSNDSIKHEKEIFDKMGIPHKDESPTTLGDYTIIDWDIMPEHYYFYFDGKTDEDFIRRSLINSELKEYEYLIITYGYNQPAVKVRISDFFKDWEGFIRSTLWESTMFTNDYKLIIEVSKKYYLHSNFKIVDRPQLV